MSARRRPPVMQFILENSLLLIGGAVIALAWANLNPASYAAFSGAVQFGVNDVAMVFFFALATKEVVEAMLPGGPLSSPGKAAVPVLAAVGGMAAPAALYATAVTFVGQPALVRGWAIPCATDIAFSYLAARLIFGAGHPAIPFLLLLAIADDALGLMLLAVFYPSGDVAPGQLAMWMAAAVGLAVGLRRARVINFWAYVLGPGTLSWIALYVGGIHPALALVPIVPFMPHAKRDLGLFDDRELTRRDTMSHFEHWWRTPVQAILLFFGLVNAGVALSSVGPVSWAIVGSLLIGKPLGIVGMTLLAGIAGFPRARGLDFRSLVVMSVAAGIGFTVALFFTTAAFPPGATLDQAKMGALLSFAGAPLAIGLGRLLGIKPSGDRRASP